MIGIELHLIHLREGPQSFVFFPQNTTGALSKKRKTIVNTPTSGRQSVDIIAPIITGKSAFNAPSMKEKSANLPKEGKK